MDEYQQIKKKILTRVIRNKVCRCWTGRMCRRQGVWRRRVDEDRRRDDQRRRDELWRQIMFNATFPKKLGCLTNENNILRLLNDLAFRYTIAVK